MEKSLGEILREYRLKSKLSQLELGKILGYSTGQFISNWERQLSYPPMNKLAQISKVFKLDSKKLFHLYIKEVTEKKVSEFNEAYFRIS